MSAFRKFLPEFVYGGTDGVVTTFAVIAGSVGASFSPQIALILGCANIGADGFSMAASDFLSKQSENELRKKDLRKKPFHAACATFFSFMIMGFIPLISYGAAIIFPQLQGHEFSLATLCAAGAFIIIGGIKGKVTNKHPVRSILETLLIGGAAAFLAYAIGLVLKIIIG